MNTPTQVLANFVCETRYEDLPTDVVRSAKYLFLDFLGCVFGGIDAAEAKIVRETIKDIDTSAEASIWGTDLRASMASAILANTTAGEGRDFSAGPMVSAESNVIPAAAAVAEKANADVKTFLLSIVVGVEVLGRILASMNTQTINRHGFYHQAVVGPFGATAAAGKLLGLNADELRRAFGISGSLAGGIFGWIAEGIRMKTIQIGSRGAESVLACYLARRGFPGSAHVIESEYGGLLRSYSSPDYDESMVVNKLGELWMTNLVPFKPYPCCRWTHPYIDCILQILARERFALEDIGSITAYGIKDAQNNVTKIVEPTTVMEANFSLPFVIAVALVDKKITFAQFTPERWNDGQVMQIARKVKFELDAQMERRHHYGALPPFVLPGGLNIELTNGRKYSAEVDHPKGMPENPMTEEELVDKFRMQAGTAMSEAKLDQIISTVMSLERIERVSQLVALFH